jgi:hypothetical protein
MELLIEASRLEPSARLPWHKPICSISLVPSPVDPLH